MTTPMAIVAPVESPELPLESSCAGDGPATGVAGESLPGDAEAVAMAVMTRFSMNGRAAVGVTFQLEVVNGGHATEVYTGV